MNTEQLRKAVGINELARDIYTRLDSIHETLQIVIAKTRDLPFPDPLVKPEDLNTQ
jgi:hypothetical protein